MNRLVHLQMDWTIRKYAVHLQMDGPFMNGLKWCLDCILNPAANTHLVLEQC